MSEKISKKRIIGIGLIIGMLVMGFFFSVNVNPVKVAAQTDALPIAMDDVYTTLDRTSKFTVAIPGVLSNDTYVNVITLNVVDQPEYGTLTLYADGSFDYTPDSIYYGPVSFKYTITDTNGTSNVATVVIYVAGTCMEDRCGTQNCTASDIDVTAVLIANQLDPCEYVGDIGTYSFLLSFSSTATERFDPTVYIGIDGGDAATGSCYMEFLHPVETTGFPAEPKLFPYDGPFLDLEGTLADGIDACGDITSTTDLDNVSAIMQTEEITFVCSQAVLGGNLNVSIAYNNNGTDLTCTNGTCPETKAKCRKNYPVPFELSLPVDLSLVKTATDLDEYGNIPSDGLFSYILTVANNQYNGRLFKSTGYTITDNLPIWLKPQLPLPTGCTAVADELEYCFNRGGCDGYGDIVTCKIDTDLPTTGNIYDDQSPGPYTAPSITLPVQLWMGGTLVDENDPRNVPPPATVPNTACVTGDDTDPLESNNCGDVLVPTSVDLFSFTATSYWKQIVLEWVTVSETNNLGFNLYRSTSPDGPKVKINADLIPADSGSVYGATYTYIDTSNLKRNTIYYYWLEDIDISGVATMHGPVEAKLLPRNPIMKPHLK